MENSISETELTSIEGLVNAATGGPWKSFLEGRDHTSGSSFITNGGEVHRGDDIELAGATDGDHDFIAAARQDVPRLIAEVRRLNQLMRVLQRT
jgi:hypothetical protein